MTERFITIGNQKVSAKEMDLPQVNLDFYPQNPRIYSLLSKLGPNPTQAEIQREMIAQNHVKILKESIKANGGLLEPIIVRNNIVLEGNSRLAAYRILASEDPIEWGMIRCNVLPDDTSDDIVTSLLGTLHIIGKTPWQPFEQAGFLVRRLENSRKPIDAIALELGIRKSIAKLYVDVYQEMMAQDDMNPIKWSYYFELLKNKDINKFEEQNPTIGYKENILEKIKDNKILQAADIRKFGTIAKASGENATEAIAGVMNDEMDINEAVELVSEETKLASVGKKVNTFYDYLLKEQDYISDNASDRNLNYKLKQIKQIIDNWL